MKLIDVFYQGEGLGEIAHLEVAPDSTFANAKARIAEKHGIGPDAFVFLEDEDEAITETVLLRDRATRKGLKIHIHHCRYVEVTVTFNGETVERRFAPGATVARVKRWAAEQKFGMSDEDSGEHVLQIAGSHERPAPSTHIGTLTERKVCGLALDLVADVRVNGAWSAR